ncbi:MAG: ABC transporter permease [Clostridia bacterium]|nr:ABC transporter permease [Clostridia bacterium]
MRRGNKRSLTELTGLNSFLSSVIAILVGLAFGFIILLISNPSQALKGILVIVKGGFNGGAKGVGQMLYYATPLILTGLSVGFAFKTGLFNIGASGQLIVGAFSAIWTAVNWKWLPGPLHWIVPMFVAILVGGLWATIPGLFKAYLGVNEVISCIMMNYIGMYGVNHLIKVTNIYDQLKNQTVSVPATAALPYGGLNKVFYEKIGNLVRPSSVNIGIIIAVIAAIVIYLLLNKTTFGYELKACGHNRDASRYAGINEKRSILMSMVIAGMLSGLAGAVMYLAKSDGLHIDVVDVLAPQGFNGIPVALLGLSNPLGIIFSGIFVAHLEQGGYYLQKLNYMPEIIDIIIGAIIYFSAFALIFKNAVQALMRRLFRRQDKED